MDAMVTARMSEEKKRSGNRVIAAAGMTPSGFIGEIYDYLIDENRLPDLTRSQSDQRSTAEKAALYKEFMAGTSFDVPSSFWRDASGGELSDDELLERALGEKYGFAH